MPLTQREAEEWLFISDYYNAFEISPVPAPAVDAVPPEPFRGFYGMPMFVTIPTMDLPGSVDFWTAGLGFFALFSIPGAAQPHAPVGVPVDPASREARNLEEIGIRALKP